MGDGEGGGESSSAAISIVPETNLGCETSSSVCNKNGGGGGSSSSSGGGGGSSSSSNSSGGGSSSSSNSSGGGGTFIAVKFPRANMSVGAVLRLQNGSVDGRHGRQQRVSQAKSAHLLESTPLGSNASEKRQTMERAQPITKADDSALRKL
jgi:hypothetical protein